MKIVATSGCFDVIHAGHVTLLEEASKLGDMLIVLVNDDQYIRDVKGHEPMMCLEDRLHIVSSIKGVDAAIPFSDKDPCRMLELIGVDVFVKGSEYKGIPEERVCKVVYIDSGNPIHSSKVRGNYVLRAVLY